MPYFNLGCDIYTSPFCLFAQLGEVLLVVFTGIVEDCVQFGARGGLWGTNDGKNQHLGLHCLGQGEGELGGALRLRKTVIRKKNGLKDLSGSIRHDISS